MESICIICADFSIYSITNLIWSKRFLGCKRAQYLGESFLDSKYILNAPYLLQIKICTREVDGVHVLPPPPTVVSLSLITVGCNTSQPTIKGAAGSRGVFVRECVCVCVCYSYWLSFSSSMSSS